MGSITEQSIKSFHDLVPVEPFADKEFNEYSVIMIHRNMSIHLFVTYQPLKRPFRDAHEGMISDLANYFSLISTDDKNSQDHNVS
jgi:hypothetical protein